MASEENSLEDLARFQASKETLEKLLPILLALDTAAVRRFTMTVPEAVASGIRIWRSYLADKADIVTSFTKKGFDPEAVVDLPDRVSALWQADVRLKQARDPESAMEELLASAVPLHAKLARAAKYLFEDDENIWPVVADIRKGSGHMDRANDLARYSELFREHWETAAGNCNVSNQDLADAQSISTKILSAYTEASESKLKELSNIRNRAGEYLCQAVDAIRDAAAYHYRTDPNAMDRYPSLFRYRKSQKRTEDDNETALETPTPVETEAPTLNKETA